LHCEIAFYITTQCRYLQTYVRKQFFSLFYLAINAGSLISTFVTPVFRADVDCYPGETEEIFDECYALAFGVPGALMVVALSK